MRDNPRNGALTPWEILCPVCGRSSWSIHPDDPDGDRCGICGQLPERRVADPEQQDEDTDTDTDG